jgi:hypothetical protein
MSKKEKLDAFLGKWLSRKLMVFLISSAALFSGKLESADWVIIAAAYIAMQGTTDIVERLMKVKSNLTKTQHNETERDF